MEMPVLMIFGIMTGVGIACGNVAKYWLSIMSLAEEPWPR